jgi:molybdopterin biosynthesis enzyme
MHFVRAVAQTGDDGRVHVRSSGGQASHLLRAMALANALVVLPDGPGVQAGATVEAMLLT